jgi:hypothetical protein
VHAEAVLLSIGPAARLPFSQFFVDALALRYEYCLGQRVVNRAAVLPKQPNLFAFGGQPNLRHPERAHVVVNVGLAGKQAIDAPALNDHGRVIELNANRCHG